MLELTAAGQIIGLISVGLTLMSTLVRSAVLDKEKMREHKEKIKECREKMKEAQKKKDMKGMQKHQQDMMNSTMEQMKHGFKPMIFTIIPFLLIFGWLRGTYGDVGYLYNVTVTDALPPGVTFNGIDVGPDGVDGRYVSSINAMVWNWSIMKAGESGELTVEFKADNPPTVDVESTSVEIEYSLKNGSVSHFTLENSAGNPQSQLKLEKTSVDAGDNKVRYSILYENLGSSRVVTLLGFNLGWFGWYFVCAIISSIIFNKIFGIT